MERVATNSHAFVIRVWLEEPPSDGRTATWRGHITHTETRTQQYIEDLAEVEAFMVPYMAAMGVKLNLRQRVALWLRGA